MIKPVAPARRARRRLRTPNPEIETRLLKAAYDLIRERGFPELRVDEITDRAGLSVGTFYLYFEGKDDLFTRLVIEHTAALRARCQQAAAGSGSVLERLTRSLVAYIDFVLENERGFLYFRNSGSVRTTVGNLSSWAFEQHAQDLRPLLEEGMKRGELEMQDPVLLTQSILGAMQHLAGFWLENKASYDREQITSFLVHIGALLTRPRSAGAREGGTVGKKRRA